MYKLLQQTLSPSLLGRRNFFLNTPITSGRKGELTNNLDAYGAAGLDKDRIEVEAGDVANLLGLKTSSEPTAPSRSVLGTGTGYNRFSIEERKYRDGKGD